MTKDEIRKMVLNIMNEEFSEFTSETSIIWQGKVWRGRFPWGEGEEADLTREFVIFCKHAAHTHRRTELAIRSRLQEYIIPKLIT